jgi:hypothetical protein
VGYDNGDGKRRSLGTSATGARVALRIFEPILQTVWVEGIAPKAPLNGPSPEAKQHLVDLPIDYQSGARIKGGSQAFLEHFRVGADGKVTDTQNQLVSREAHASRHAARSEADQEGRWDWGWGNRGATAEQGGGAWGWGQQQRQPAPPQNRARGPYAPWSNSDERRGC